MTAPSLVSDDIVNFSLKSASAASGRWQMVDHLIKANGRMPVIVVAGLLLLSATGAVATPLLWITGRMSTDTIINDRMATISGQIKQLQDDLRTVPRADQIIVLDRHLSAQDGRMDSIDTRLRDLEQRVSRAEAQVGAINAASAASLAGKR